MQNNQTVSHRIPRRGNPLPFRLRSFLPRAGPGARAELVYQPCQRFGTAAITDDDFVTGLRHVSRKGLANAPCTDDADGHLYLLDIRFLQVVKSPSTRLAASSLLTAVLSRFTPFPRVSDLAIVFLRLNRRLNHLSGVELAAG